MVEYLDIPYEKLDRPLWWHKGGLSQTASGYGKKLISRTCIKLADGRIRRVYVTCFSNTGSAWIILNGRTLYLRGE